MYRRTMTRSCSDRSMSGRKGGPAGSPELLELAAPLPPPLVAAGQGSGCLAPLLTPINSKGCFGTANGQGEPCEFGRGRRATGPLGFWRAGGGLEI